MKRVLLLAVFALTHSIIAYGQQTIGALGGDLTSISGSVSYTVGQIDYLSVSNLNGSVYQGVQQPFEITTIGLHEYGKASWSVTVFPNPATSFVTLQVANPNFERLSYQLYDLYGRVVSSSDNIGGQTIIPMSSFSSSTYLLKVSCDNKIQFFKIIKN